MLAVTKRRISSPRRRLSAHTCDIGHSLTVPAGLCYLCETLVPMSASRGRDRCEFATCSGPSFMSQLPMIRLRQGDAPLVNSHRPKANTRQWSPNGQTVVTFTSKPCASRNST